MSDVYLIKKETLTKIADSIRANSPDSWAGCDITPEQMPDTIGDVYNEGYGYGYDDGYSEGKKITDLTGTSIEIGQGWYAEAGYGEFEIDCTMTDLNNGYVYDVYKIQIGYNVSNKPSVNRICFHFSNSDVTSRSYPSGYSFYLKITGGVDATNPDLIDWLHAYGILKSYAYVRDESYNEGYNEGYSNGYDNGYSFCLDEVRESLEASNFPIPIIIQNGLSPADSFDDVDYYYLDDFEKFGYTIDDFIEYSDNYNSATFGINVVNNTALTVRVYMYAECYSYSQGEGGYFDEWFQETVTIGANSSGSISVTSRGESDYSWYYEIYVRFES